MVRTRRQRGGERLPGSRPTQTATRPSAAHHERVLDLQRSAGNRATSDLIVQRSGLLESISEGLGDLWGDASKTAGALWDSLTGGGAKDPPAPQRPRRPDHAANYVVADPNAFVRSPPPELDGAAYGYLRIPKGSSVRVLGEQRKAGRLYVEVAATPPIPFPRCWTAYSNIDIVTAAPKTEPGGGGGGGGGSGLTLAEELEKIDAIVPPEYVERAGDEAKRALAIELATSAKPKAVADLLKLLDDHGQTPESWFGRINPSATFLGVEIKGSSQYAVGGVHDELYQRLKVAEAILEDETKKDPVTLGKEFQIKGIGGLREVKPATRKATGIGRHSLGLAIDIKSGTGPNPLLEPLVEFKEEMVPTAEAAVIERAARFVKIGRAIEFGVGDPATKGTGKTSLEKRVTQADEFYDVISDASRSLQAYLKFETATEIEIAGATVRLADLAAAFGAATGDVRTVDQWQARIAEDRKNLTGKKRPLGPDPSKGFLNLEKQMVMALVKAGLTWGGTLDNEKDIHHFGLHSGPIPAKKGSSTA